MKTSAVLLALSLAGAWVFASDAAAAGLPGQIADRVWLQVVLGVAQQAADVVAAGYRRAPAVVIVLSALLILPAIALVSFLARRAERATRRQPRAIPTSPLADDMPAWSAQAWLSIDGEGPGAHPIAGEMIRIGRHPDNEVWLTDTSVHRYHAVIHRTEGSGFFITDLSGEEGNGVRINGTRRAQSQLANGDIIELGKARMTFANTTT